MATYRGEKRDLILQMLRSFKHVVHHLEPIRIDVPNCIIFHATYIDNMLALIPLHVIGTSAVRQLANCDVVDIPSRTRHLNHFFGDFIGALAGAVDDEHPIESVSKPRDNWVAQAAHLCSSARLNLCR